ncbi:DUF4235 domain-containing protein [Cellulomonas taurus]|uniref:DUF4235 domain-containing protein n=1 Tax=Cellulomonas taurus TaxID=2729175 RepID=UPI00145EA46C|nr:DUF4235 domain-containing protein [Cellulomonas taurus]
MSDEEQNESTLAKVTGLIVAGAVAWVAQKALTAVWKKTLGHEPPQPENPGDSRLGEVVAAAAITGAVVSLARVMATRGTAHFSKRVNDGRHLPGKAD